LKGDDLIEETGIPERLDVGTKWVDDIKEEAGRCGERSRTDGDDDERLNIEDFDLTGEKDDDGVLNSNGDKLFGLTDVDFEEKQAADFETEETLPGTAGREVFGVTSDSFDDFGGIEYRDLIKSVSKTETGTS
jgi:hypothetical protein